MASYQQFAPPPQQQQPQRFSAAAMPYTATAINGAAPARSSIDDDDDQLVEAMERLLSAETNRRMLASSLSACRDGSPAAAAASSHVGPLTASELDILSLCCTKAAHSLSIHSRNLATTTAADAHGFGAVDGDLLTTLCELLEKHVNLAVNVDLVQEAIGIIHKREVKIDQWLRNGAVGGNRVTALRLGLEAAAILLFIVTSPGVETRVVSEDAIEASFMLLRHHLTKNIIPALSNSGHLLASQAEDAEKGIASPRNNKRKRKSSGGEGNAVVRELKKVYKPILNMMSHHITLMERIENAVQTIYLDDQQILALTSGAMKALEIESTPSSQNPANRLQYATISLVTAAFRKFPMHRASIVEDLFPLMLQLPTAKKSMRAYHVRYNSCPSPESTRELNTELFASTLTNGALPHSIQMITAMVLAFVQCCVVRPTVSDPQANNDGDDAHDGDYNDNGMNNGGAPQKKKYQNRLASGLQGCQAVADAFANQLLMRCSRKGEDGGASEFRPILTNFMEDLLLVLMIPEYHAAQMILLSLTHGLSRDVIIASQSSNSSTSANSETVVETTYVNTAFDTLGRICAAYAKLLAAHRSKELHTTVEVVPEDENVLRCYCKRNDFTSCLMIDCDNCHTWYHAKCVGIHRDTLPNDWLCDGCSCQAMVQQEQAVPGHSNESRGIIDETYVVNRVVENHLSMRFPLALQYHLALWVEELNRCSMSKQGTGRSAGYEHAIGQILEHWDEPSVAPNRRFGFTQEGGARALLSLTVWYSNFMKSFNALMGLLVKLMSDKAHASLRKQSIKAIEKVVDADPKLMLLPKVMDAVSLRLSDESTSVREAVVSLVGSYVVSSPVLANAFHSHLIPRLLDQGVSVRKRTVKILQDILCTNPHYNGRSDACDKCLQRAADPKEDDGVREALHAMFMKLWLEDGDLIIASNTDSSVSPVRNGLVAPSSDKSPPGSAGGQSVASGVVTPTPPLGSRTTRSHQKEIGKLRSDLAAEQMVAAVKVAGTNENLGSFMRELLCNVNDSDKGKKAAERMKRQKIAQKQCFNLVDALFELLLTTEEKRPALGAALGPELVATVRTIGVFAEVSTASVMKHLGTIIPYLKADNGLSQTEESALASASADIVYRVAPILDQNEILRLSQGSLGQDLVKISYKYGAGALYSSIRALCTLAHHRDAGENNIFGKKLLNLARTCYAYLYKNASSDDFSDVSTKNNTKRLLSGLGSLCRHHEVHVDTEIWNEEVETEGEFELCEPAELDWENIPVACFRLFSKYMEKPDSEIKCASLRALGGIFVEHPRLMLASAQFGLIEDVMSSDAPLELQMEALRCWKDISLAEEKRIDSGDAKKKMDRKHITQSKKISGDQDGDSSLVGGVMTTQSPRLFEMTQGKEPGLRMASLELLGQLLRQGLVNPNEAVPYLLSLQGDVGDVVVRQFALNLLIIEGEKRPDMLRQRVCAGIKQACRFQREVYPGKEPSALIKKNKAHRSETDATVFDEVFKACIISSRKQREGLYRNLIAMFERVEPDKKSQAPSSAKKARNRRRSSLEKEPGSTENDISLLSFAAQVLAYLPYVSAGDPLFIQHHITSIVALQGPLLQDRLAAFLRPFGLSSSDELDDANAEEDALELAAKRSAPSRSKEAAPLNKENFDWLGFIALCKEASALSLLLRLKTFLRKRYNLTEGRCLEYNPDAKEKSFGRSFISRAENLAPFDSSYVHVDEASMVSGCEPHGYEIDHIIEAYAGFRIAMRRESGGGDDADFDSDEESEMPPAAIGEADEELGSDAEGDHDEVAMAVQQVAKPKKKRRSSVGGSSRKKRRSSG